MQMVFATIPLFAEMQRRGWFPLWAALLLGVVAIIAVGILYLKEAGRLSVGRRLLLLALRMAIVATVAFLLLRPTWVSEEKGERSRPVVVLIDISQSMDNQDPRPNTDDQGRVAIALGLTEPDKLPDAATLSGLGSRLPDRPKRIDVARAALLNPKIDLFQRLAGSAGPLEVYTFGTTRLGRNWQNLDWLKELAADEPRTALVEAGFEVLNRDDTDAPAALVIVTDGRENAGPKSLDDLARECARRNIPIYVYGVGSSSFGQLSAAFGPAAPTDKPASASAPVATNVDVPNTLFVDDVANIPVRYTVKGVANGTANIVLKYGDREVLTERHSFALTAAEVRDGKTFSQVLKFTPTKQDADSKKQEYAVTVTINTGSGTTADRVSTVVSRPSQVVNRKLKVLVVDSLPRYDFKFLQRALLRDRRVDARFYLTEGDRLAMRSGPPWMIDFSREINGTLNMDREEFRKILFDFDLLILGDVPGNYFSREQQEIIKDFVTEGGGLITIAGRWHSPAGWSNDRRDAPTERNPIADVLPVEFDAVRFPIQALDNPEPFVPVLAPAASRTQIVSLEDDPIDNAELWGKAGTATGLTSEKQLKPMYWYYPVTKTKPAADVFLVHPTARTPTPDDKPMPLLVGHHYGKGYVLFVAFDDTWRWRFNTAEKLFGRFWSQAVYTAGIPRIVGTKQTQISTNTPAPTVGKTGEIYVRAFNENFLPIVADEIDGTLEKLDANPNDKDRLVPVKFRRVPGVEGEFVTTLPYNRVGQFRLTVDPKNKQPATLNFPVNYDTNDERAPAALDAAAMMNLSRDTGVSKLYREENLVQLPGDVKPQLSAFSQREETLLWNRWTLFLLLGLLTAEWCFRKVSGLS